MNARTIGIISVKGGVGKTSAVSALGASLANDFNKKVLLIDANFSAPTLGLHVGLFNPEVTIHHVLNGQANVKDAIYETCYGFHVMPGALIFEKINPLLLAEKIRDLKKRYDVILIDSSPNMNEEVLATMIASDELLMMTTPDYITLISTLRAIRLAREKRTPIIGLILNRVHNRDFELSMQDIEDTCGCQVLAVLPHELEILEALSLGIPSTMHSATRSTREYKQLAGSLIGETHNDGKIKSFLKKLTQNIPKQEVNRTIFAGNRKNY